MNQDGPVAASGIETCLLVEDRHIEAILSKREQSVPARISCISITFSRPCAASNPVKPAPTTAILGRTGLFVLMAPVRSARLTVVNLSTGFGRGHVSCWRGSKAIGTILLCSPDGLDCGGRIVPHEHEHSTT